MKPLNGTGLHKRCQAGGPFDGDIQREDAFVWVRYEDKDEYIKEPKKKQRGRKNRLNIEVEKLDNKHGAILDSDRDGNVANVKMRAEYLASIREEDDEVLKKSKILRKKIT